MAKVPDYLKLNCYDREKVPVFESHDPSMMWDPVSETCYSYSTDTAVTSKREIGIPIRKSKDLVSFTYVGLALSEKAVQEGRDNGSFPPTAGFWAPYAEYDKTYKEYRMYYSATKAFGSSESRIWLAVAKHPEGPFENRGVVMDTWNTSDALPNAIDPHVVRDRGGRMYLIYGSFFGGIFIKELNAETGLPADGSNRTLGACIAKRPRRSPIDGPEGAAVIYCPETDYFYLFLSYGWLGDGYDIRVARSRDVTGPYLDFDGKNMVQETLGTKLAGSYRFEAEQPNAFFPSGKAQMPGSDAGTQRASYGAGKGEVPDRKKAPDPNWSFGGFRGPGHGVPFYAPKPGAYFFVHHVRDGAACLQKSYGGRTSYHAHYMMVRRMDFVNGWPVFCPEPYSGEDSASVRESIRAAAPGKSVVVKGENRFTALWETITFLPMDNGQQNSGQRRLDCRLDENGVWMLTDGKETISAKLFTGWDFENGREGVFFSGFLQDGKAVWGKL